MTYKCDHCGEYFEETTNSIGYCEECWNRLCKRVGVKP